MNKIVESKHSVSNSFIPSKILDQIHSMSLADAISNQVMLKQNGKGYVGLCPFHKEETPSFYVFPGTNRYKCFGCNKSGDLISFYQEQNHTDFPDTIKEIAARFNLIVESSEMSQEEMERYNRKEQLYQINKFAADWFREQLLQPEYEEALRYVKNRWNNEAIEFARLGFAPDNWDSFKNAALNQGYTEDVLKKAGLLTEKDGKTFTFFKNRVMFPLFNKHTRVVGFSARVLVARENSPKYLNSPGTEVFQKSSFLYGLNLAIKSIRENKEVYLVEGYADVIRLQQLGILNVVGLCGTSLSKEHLAELKQFTDSITIIGDSDGPGQTAVNRSAGLIINSGMYCKVIPLPHGDEKADPDSFFTSKEQFDKIEKSCKLDYIIWNLKERKKEYSSPDLIVKLINDTTTLLAKIPESSHPFYIKEFAKIIPTRKIWDDSLRLVMEKEVKQYAMQNPDRNVSEIQGNSTLKQLHDFYFIEKDKDGYYRCIKIDRVNLIERLKLFGFYRYDLTLDNHRFVRIIDNTVSEVSTTGITDFFIDFVENLEGYQHTWDEDTKFIDRITIKEKLFNGLDTYFSTNLLKRLKPDNPINIKKDTKNEKFLFFQNGYVSITLAGHVFHSYNDLDAYVWSNQILKRNFNPIADKENLVSPYQTFIYNICAKDEQRLQAMKTIIGYAMHNFTDCKLHAIILTDSRLSNDDEPNGRTGKTLWGRGFGHILNADEKNSRVFTEISGKDFRPDNKFKYSKASLDTQVIHINDIYNNYNIENSFNDITEGIEVDKKNEDPFRIQPKFILSTNKTIKIDGESAKDRVIQFEFADYYNSTFSPEIEFGHWFFRDWDEDQWCAFDYFMISCVHEYLKHGLIKPLEINLSLRTLRDHSSQDFINFMDDCFSADGLEVAYPFNGTELKETIKIIPDEKVSKKSLFESFIRSYNDWNNPKFKQRNFTLWVRNYSKYKKLNLEETRPGGKDHFTFTTQ